MDENNDGAIGIVEVLPKLLAHLSTEQIQCLDGRVAMAWVGDNELNLLSEVLLCTLRVQFREGHQSQSRPAAVFQAYAPFIMSGNLVGLEPCLPFDIGAPKDQAAFIGGMPPSQLRLLWKLYNDLVNSDVTTFAEELIFPTVWVGFMEEDIPKPPGASGWPVMRNIGTITCLPLASMAKVNIEKAVCRYISMSPIYEGQPAPTVKNPSVRVLQALEFLDEDYTLPPVAPGGVLAMDEDEKYALYNKAVYRAMEVDPNGSGDMGYLARIFSSFVGAPVNAVEADSAMADPYLALPVPLLPRVQIFQAKGDKDRFSSLRLSYVQHEWKAEFFSSHKEVKTAYHPWNFQQRSPGNVDRAAKSRRR